MSERVFKTIESNGTVLKILFDANAENPRKEWDNLGKMVCWHRRYSLGDDHQFDSPSDFLDSIKGKDVVLLPLYLYDHSGLTMSTTPFSCPWDSGQVGFIYAEKDVFRNETAYTEKALFGTNKAALIEVGDYVTVKNEVRPHFGKVEAVENGIISVDWTYLYVASRHDDPSLKGRFPYEQVELVTEYAKTMLQNEVKTYDQYLKGDVFGFLLEDQQGNYIDSCWGFYGEDPFLNGMHDQMPEAFKDLLKQIA
jgi:hypothetical protein